ncbi:hypothetical protein, partial [Escherichia coli]|uniref:hypothetical protein n=1 Tax=Escherichia coli TaxID=562 RepID=UPI001BAE8CA5
FSLHRTGIFGLVFGHSQILLVRIKLCQHWCDSANGFFTKKLRKRCGRHGVWKMADRGREDAEGVSVGQVA